VRVETETDLRPLHADRAQLETVLINLGTNSRDAMPSGGTLDLNDRNVQLIDSEPSEVALPPGNYVRITVTDNGSGMNAATLARASEPFFTTKGVGRGTGLGLAMARGFAEQSGGALVIDSRIGSGTSVHLWLPCTELTASTRTPRQTGESPSRALRILVVDDDPLVLEVLSAQLRDLGHTVATASDGVDALDQIAVGSTLDLLITDFSMQKMNGVALIREAQARLPGLCSILLTGYMDNDAIQNWSSALNTRVNTMHKPVSGIELAMAIAKLPPMAQRHL
jgi:CheY-like chemotaxis protein